MRRPAPIGRGSVSSASVSSLNSLSRPSLLADIRQDLVLETTPWHVADTSLRPVPPFYPPLDPRCTAIINDSTPSVVAVRISECLKKRSISVEYDEETITATCLTVDRVHFQINLYRGSHRIKPPANPECLDEKPDLSHAVIVEVLRTRGSVLSFHHHNRSILNAAMGHASGEDERLCIRTSPMEFPRLERSSGEEKPAKRRARTLETPRAIEHALSLLRKDRIGAQRLGMESLVNLTDIESSGVDIAIHASMVVIGSPILTVDEMKGGSSTSEETHELVIRLIRDRVLVGEEKEDVVDGAFDLSVDDLASSDDSTGSGKSSPGGVFYDAHHGGLLRSMSLRVLANALTVLSENEGKLLTEVLKNSQLTSPEFVHALAEDLLGASRLPAVVAGTRLASVHEAALATRCIAILSEHCPAINRMLANPKSNSNPTLEILQRNRNVAHDVLVNETKNAYAVLSQDFRSC